MTILKAIHHFSLLIFLFGSAFHSDKIGTYYPLTNIMGCLFIFLMKALIFFFKYSWVRNKQSTDSLVMEKLEEGKSFIQQYYNLKKEKKR